MRYPNPPRNKNRNVEYPALLTLGAPSVLLLEATGTGMGTGMAVINGSGVLVCVDLELDSFSSKGSDKRVSPSNGSRDFVSGFRNRGFKKSTN